jgi:hypothetical protein
VFGGEVFTPTETVQAAQVMLSDFKLANMREPRVSTTEELTDKWMAPSNGYLKVN